MNLQIYLENYEIDIAELEKETGVNVNMTFLRCLLSFEHFYIDKFLENSLLNLLHRI